MTETKTSVWEWTQAALLATNLIWTTLLRGGFPPQVRVVTASLTIALLVVHWVARVVPHARIGAATKNASETTRSAFHLAGWFFVPFLVYAAANVLWVSPVPWLGWRDWFGWAEMFAVFWVVLNGIRSCGPQRVLFFTIVLLAIAGVLLACYQVFVNPEWQMLGGARTWYRGRASGSFGMPNSFAAFLLFALPAAAALGFRRGASATQRVWWGWVTLVLAFGFVLTISRGAWLALLGALTVWPLCALRGHWLRRIGFAGLVFVVVGLVGAFIAAKSPAMQARFAQLAHDAGERTRPIMWRAAWKLFYEQPLVGTGAGSYDVLFEKYRPEQFNDDPLFAHNDYLNTLSDYGAAGFLLFFGAGAWVAWRCGRGPREKRAHRRDALGSPSVLTALAIGLLAFALQLVVEFHFKIPALALAFAVIAGLVVSRRWPVEEGSAPGPRTRGVSAAVAAGVAALFLLFFLPQFRAEARRKPVRAAIDALAGQTIDAARYRRVLEPARAALARATTIDPTNGQAWADLAYATVLWSHVDARRDAELGRAAESAAERALGCSRACYEFWIRRGLARDLQGRWSEAGEDFLAAVKLTPSNPLAWYYYAEHLSRVYAVRESADAAAAFCLRLDPGNALGLALRQRLAITPKAR